MTIKHPGHPALLAWTLILAASTADAEPPLNPGELACDSSRGGCRLAWNMTGAAHGNYQLQTYSVKNGGWKNVGKAGMESYTTLEKKVRGGRLYRVLACDDSRAGANCTSSTVHWVLDKPSTVEIPEQVFDKAGTPMLISKDEDRLSQLDQHNVYLLVRLLEQIDDLAAMPPMTRPRLAGESMVIDETLTDDDQIYGSIYHNYEAQRALVKEQG